MFNVVKCSLESSIVVFVRREGGHTGTDKGNPDTQAITHTHTHTQTYSNTHTHEQTMRV